MTTPVDPVAMLRSRNYLRLLALAAIIGVPVSAAAYWYLYLVGYLQKEIFTDLPHGLGFSSEPAWWPLPVRQVGENLLLQVAHQVQVPVGRHGNGHADDGGQHQQPYVRAGTQHCLRIDGRRHQPIVTPHPPAAAHPSRRIMDP